jgi:hypothetical protein
MVRSLPYSRIFGLLCLVVAGSWSSSACLVKNGDDDDAAGTGGMGGAGGTTAMGGTGGAAAGMAGMSGSGNTASSCAPGHNVFACGMQEITSTSFIDFTTYTLDRKWGKSNGIHGGTSLYKGTGEDLTVAAEGADLKVTGTIPSMSYAGAVFWVSACSDVSAYQGVKLSISGDATVSGSIQLQSSENYPVDPSASKGECAYTSCDTRWTECMPPRTTFAVTTNPSEVSYSWDDFMGGAPVETFSPNQLVGVQYQFECQDDADCDVNLTLGSVTFLE